MNDKTREEFLEDMTRESHEQAYKVLKILDGKPVPIVIGTLLAAIEQLIATLEENDSEHVPNVLRMIETFVVLKQSREKEKISAEMLRRAMRKDRFEA